MIYSSHVNNDCVKDRELLNNNRDTFLHKYNLIIIYEFDRRKSRRKSNELMNTININK